ncbi:transmembrane protein, putative [Medicago truncatula]|uniref:Transmembrane protein, putative n=1 Tax=Medicago truncatula TaxID=3880 RepID=G7KLR9_MEDTR|nr:transmembrane protein, putative [Medicago truncatula]
MNPKNCWILGSLGLTLSLAGHVFCYMSMRMKFQIEVYLVARWCPKEQVLNHP